MARRAHLIGSVGLLDAETVFITVSSTLGSCCPRIPDGETGERGYWIRWQRGTFASHPAFEVAAKTSSLAGFKDSLERTFYRLKKDIDPHKLEFGELGYAREAVKSYAIFARLVDEGKIAAGTRFQVSLPTPTALVCGFVALADRKTVKHAVERAMVTEVDLIQRAIPVNRLSIQWDVCYEILGAEGYMLVPYSDSIAGAATQIGFMCSKVDPGAEVGIHLCYGDPGHKHIVEPKDLGLCVAFANAICRATARLVNFVHMPIPRSWTDGTYYAPLALLAMPQSTRLVLGLIHFTDGIEGARGRINFAERHQKEFDVATECGFGRRDAETIPGLLNLHKALCSD